MAYLIAGHHAGLPDWYPGEQPGPLADRVSRNELLDRVLRAAAPTDILKQQEPLSQFVGGREGFALWVRMLFSCLVDADFLDTEAFMDPERSAKRTSSATMELLLSRFNAYTVAGQLTFDK